MVEKFEDLVAWQKARALTREIYRLTNVGGFSRDFGLRDQVRRASVSVMSNITEGFDRYSRPEFKQFLSIARGSCAEVRAQLYVAQDAGYIDEENANRLRADASEVSRIIGGLHASL